jgi:hypothetical protein
MGIAFDFLTGHILWSSGTTGGTTPTVDGVLLMENDDYFITESGDYLATE